MGQNDREMAEPRSYRQARDVTFLQLRDTVLCAECELISYNHSPRCLSCGSTAVLSLARTLGSLRGAETARLVADEAFDELLRSPHPPLAADPEPWPMQAPVFDEPAAIACASASMEEEAAAPVLQFGVQRAVSLTGASGAAVAMAEGNRMVCRARAGATAPDLGAEVASDGLTALTVRTRQLWRCNDTEREPWVDRESCRQLGIRSLVAAPVIALDKVAGVLEVFSPAPDAFDDYRTATVQLLAGVIAIATLRESMFYGAQTRLQDAAVPDDYVQPYQ